MDTVYNITIALFVIAGVVGSYRLLAGPSLADRIIAMDLTLIAFMGAIVTHAAKTGSTTNLIMLIVLAIVGFTATVAAARFLQHEHSHQPHPLTQPSQTAANP
jgi:multicomponent Na+:H+ antiporter subunit F